MCGEVFYIKRLRVLTDLFLGCLRNLQNESLLTDVRARARCSQKQLLYMRLLSPFIHVRPRTTTDQYRKGEPPDRFAIVVVRMISLLLVVELR